MDYVPDTDDDYPPPTQALEDRVAYLRKIGALIKAEFYNSDAIEREAAHQAFDVIIERSIFNEQSKFIILQENRALREEVCRITEHIERLRALNGELAWRLDHYEDNDIETECEGLTSDNEDASSSPTVSRNIQPEAAFLSGPDTAFSQLEGDVDVVPPWAVTDEGESGKRHNSSKPVNTLTSLIESDRLCT